MQISKKLKVVAAFAVASLVFAGCSKSASEEEAAPAEEAAAVKGTGPLKIGSLLPETGNLAFLGPPEFAGIDLAVAEINAAGGVLEQPIEHIRGDSGDTSTDIAQQTADSHIAA
nr:ABC transporter substrate-binding protein [Actinomycetota bacterium]